MGIAWVPTASLAGVLALPLQQHPGRTSAVVLAAGSPKGSLPLSSSDRSLPPVHLTDDPSATTYAAEASAVPDRMQVDGASVSGPLSSPKGTDAHLHRGTATWLSVRAAAPGLAAWPVIQRVQCRSHPPGTSVGWAEAPEPACVPCVLAQLGASLCVLRRVRHHLDQLGAHIESALALRVLAPDTAFLQQPPGLQEGAR